MSTPPLPNPNLVRIAQQLNINASRNVLSDTDIERIRLENNLPDTMTDQQVIERFGPRRFTTRDADELISNIMADLIIRGLVSPEDEARAFGLIETHLLNPSSSVPRFADPLTQTVLNAVTERERIIRVFPNEVTDGQQMSALLSAMFRTGFLDRTSFERTLQKPRDGSGDDTTGQEAQVWTAYLDSLQQQLPAWRNAVLLRQTPNRRGDFFLDSIDTLQKQEIEPRQQGLLPGDRGANFILRTLPEFQGVQVQTLRQEQQAEAFNELLMTKPGQALEQLLGTSGLPRDENEVDPSLKDFYKRLKAQIASDIANARDAALLRGLSPETVQRAAFNTLQDALSNIPQQIKKEQQRIRVEGEFKALESAFPNLPNTFSEAQGFVGNLLQERFGISKSEVTGDFFNTLSRNILSTTRQGKAAGDGKLNIISSILSNLESQQDAIAESQQEVVTQGIIDGLLKQTETQQGRTGLVAGGLLDLGLIDTQGRAVPQTTGEGAGQIDLLGNLLRPQGQTDRTPTGQLRGSQFVSGAERQQAQQNVLSNLLSSLSVPVAERIQRDASAGVATDVGGLLKNLLGLTPEDAATGGGAVLQNIEAGTGRKSQANLPGLGILPTDVPTDPGFALRFGAAPPSPEGVGSTVTRQQPFLNILPTQAERDISRFSGGDRPFRSFLIGRSSDLLSGAREFERDIRRNTITGSLRPTTTSLLPFLRRNERRLRSEFDSSPEAEAERRETLRPNHNLFLPVI